MPNVTTSSNAATAVSDNKPLTLIRLMVLLVKGFIKNIPKMIIWTIVRAVFSFLAVLAIHTFFVVVRNEGFYPDASNPVYRLIAFPETRTESLAFWSIATFLLTSLAGRVWFGGPLKLVRDFIDTPIWIIEGFQNSRKRGLTAFLAAIVAAVALSFLFASPYLVFTLMIGLFLSITSRQQGLWFLVLTTAWSDIRGLAKKERTADHNLFAVLLFGLFAGLLFSIIAPFGLYGRIALIVLGIGGIVLTRIGKLQTKALLWIGILFVASSIVFRVTSVYADDGGWIEAGANFWDWWHSPGRADAIRMGLTPAMISLIAALLGGTSVPKPPPIPDVMTYRPEGWQWHKEGDKWVLYQTHNGTKYGTGIPESIFDTDPDLIGNRIGMYTTPTVDNSAAVNRINEAVENFGPGYMNRFTMSGWKNLSPTEKANSLTAISKVIAEAAGVKPNSFTLNIAPEADTGSFGAWNPGSRVLDLNTNSSIYDNPLKIIQTLTHELRHAAQGDASVDMGGDQGYRDLITWNDQNSNYQSAGTDYTRYAGQLLERDAEAFGNDVSRAFILNVIKTRYGLE